MLPLVYLGTSETEKVRQVNKRRKQQGVIMSHRGKLGLDADSFTGGTTGQTSELSHLRQTKFTLPPIHPWLKATPL